MNDDALISKCFFLETSAHQASKNLDSLIVFCIVLHALSFIPAADWQWNHLVNDVQKSFASNTFLCPSGLYGVC